MKVLLSAPCDRPCEHVCGGEKVASAQLHMETAKVLHIIISGFIHIKGMCDI